MSTQTLQFEHLQKLLITIKGQQVLLDSDVAKIYGLETKRVNEAVKNNLERFPDGYMFELTPSELADLRSNFSTAKFSKTRVLPKAFTEKGLYMLATVLKSKQAVNATFLIIETFSKIKELSKVINALPVTENESEQKLLMHQSGKLLADIFDDNLQKSDSETSIELNFAILKLKHTIKKKRN